MSDILVTHFPKRPCSLLRFWNPNLGLNWPAKQKSQNKSVGVGRGLTIVLWKFTKCAPSCRLQPTSLQASVWRYHMVFPNEEVVGSGISILLSLPLPTGRPPHTPWHPSTLIKNSQHIVGPLCKRKSPWIIEAVSFCFSQSSVHCGKLISQAEALQKDLSKSAAIVQSPLLGFVFFLTPPT